MKRLVTALAGAGLMLALAPPAVSPAASNNATTLTPLPDGTQLETFVRLDCHHANGSCDFTVGADRRAGDGVTGFPNDLWSRQSTTIRPSGELRDSSARPKVIAMTTVTTTIKMMLVKILRPKSSFAAKKMT